MGQVARKALYGAGCQEGALMEQFARKALYGALPVPDTLLRKAAPERSIMHIEHAVISDLPRIMEIYACARRFMAENGNPRQWGPTNWPPESLIRSDIEAGNLYVCVKDEGDVKEDADEGVQKTPGAVKAGSVCTGQASANRVVAVFFYIAGEDIEPCYAGIEDGAWLDPSPYGVVHRIASDGSVKGAGSFCIRWAYEQCGHLRIDTHPDNKVMQGLLAKLGFRRCGIIHVVEDRDPRYAYELSGKMKGWSVSIV